MEPLTDAEKDHFAKYCDSVVREADAAYAWWRSRGDKYMASRFNIEALAHRMVALRLRSEQVAEAAR